ncbi:thioredoxin family protein [Desulfococcaceae bacterium HSG9]|nr:thioredoxin family protein [Desulfococcaceae bacterium HSG9]
MKIEILGAGCASCDQLYQNTIDAVAELNDTADVVVEKVNDINYFASLGVFMTPGFVIDSQPLSTGKVLTKAQILKMIEEKI